VAIGDSALFNNGFGTVNIYEAVSSTAVWSKALYMNTTVTTTPQMVLMPCIPTFHDTQILPMVTVHITPT